MLRKGCPNKKKSGIIYPRKCEHCDYISNNPAMYSIHKKTHQPIPDGQLCDHGCGQNAIMSLKEEEHYLKYIKISQVKAFLNFCLAFTLKKIKGSPVLEG